MTKVKQTQLLLLSVAVVVFVLLYIAPKRSDSPKEKQGETKSSITTFANIESFVKTAGGMLAPELKTQHDALLNKQSFDSLVKFWDKAKRPDIASYYFEKTAAKSNSALNWFKAGDRYYYSIRFIKDVNEIPALYQSAMRCYESGLKLEPKNVDGQIMLAACYVEGSQDPMKGITMLREIEKTDSNNIKLQLNFAFFSAKSQQWDKAIARFQKVLKIDPNYIEAYLHLADAYEQQGDKAKTIEMLEKYVANSNDVEATQEIKKYIQQLKTE